ncbi:MAG: hypothetical protein E7645_05135 [Ruminococcaceae bacterium]|nr:hypothetical protein [Oscillospiraceae bacterium]
MKNVKNRLCAHPLVLILTISLLLLAALFTTVAMAADSSDKYVEAPVVIDFTDPDNVYGCTGANNVALSCIDEGMLVQFAETDPGSCFDPYFNLPLPEGDVDSANLHYMAILVKTNKQDLPMQVRLRTTNTGSDYPCYNVYYQRTDDWQLLICDLTDRSKVMFYNKDITGVYTNFRLDMYENKCPVNTSYIIKAYALYDNLEDAMTFAHYESPKFNADDLLPDVDFPSFWRGEAFAHPDNFEKILWVDYGFHPSTFETKLNQFEAQGFGGIVSNVNFNQQYLKDEAEFELLKRVYMSAVERKMNVWIYDEYQWPSGKAYGQVLDGHDEYEATGIKHKILTGKGGTVSYTLEGREIRVMEAILKDSDGERVLDLKDNTFEPVTANGKWSLDIYVLQYTFEGEEDRTNFEKLRDVDLLNKAAVARFIELTHEHYKSAFGDDFNIVDAFFTDEPQLGNRDREDYAVWTGGLDVLFKETYGYDLPIHAIFNGDDDASKLARMQYYALVADLFKASYIDQISAWCEKNGVNSSGHLLFEENMNDHVETYGGNFLQIIGGMTIPGADILWVDPAHLMSNSNIGTYMGLRYVTSGAKNAGRNRVMLEYNPSAALTEEFAKDVMGSSIGGATLTRLFGTTEYTMINPQNDYRINEINLLNNYIGRLNTLLADTKETGDVGIFYPIATIQALHDADSIHSSAQGEETDKAVKLNNDYASLCKQLLTAQVLYTVIDDESICSAEISTDGRLIIGNGAYRVMILAYADYISAEAAEKLAAFCKAGGTVVFVNGTPDKSLDGKGDDRVVAAMASMNDQPSYKSNRIPKMCIDVANMSNNIMSIGSCLGAAKTEILYGDFADDTHDLSYFANTTASPATLSVTFRDGYDGTYTLYFPYSGNILSGSGNKISLSVPAYEAVIVMREDDNTADAPVIGGENETQPAETSPVDENPTDTATDEPSVDTIVTEAPATQAPTATQPVENNEGCGSLLPASAVVLGAACAAAVALKKKEND